MKTITLTDDEFSTLTGALEFARDERGEMADYAEDHGSDKSDPESEAGSCQAAADEIDKLLDKIMGE